MYTILIAGALGMTGTLIAYIIIGSYTIGSYTIWEEIKGAIGPAISVGVICSFVGTFIALAIGESMPYDQIEHCSKTIVSVNSNTSISGSFVFGCGSIEQNNKYRVYQKIDGGIQQAEYSVDNTRIFEDSSPESARVVHNTRIFKKKSYSNWGIQPRADKYGSYEIHVPPGSVTRSFRID